MYEVRSKFLSPYTEKESELNTFVVATHYYS